jgi:hypothetical protein
VTRLSPDDKAAYEKIQRGDAADSGGDASALGQTIATLVVDNRRKFYLATLIKIADDYPSDWDKQMQRTKAGEQGAAGPKVQDRADPGIGTKKK